MNRSRAMMLGTAFAAGLSLASLTARADDDATKNFLRNGTIGYILTDEVWAVYQTPEIGRAHV